MVEKIVVDSKKSDQETMLALGAKLNEVIELISTRQVALASRRPLVPGPTQHVEYLEVMTKRLESGPYKSLSQSEPNELTKAIGDALTALQEAIQTYKKSLVGATEG